MSFASEADYEAAAVAFMSKPAGGTMNEGVRVRDGHIIRFDSATNEFGICDLSGFITTYFIPHPAVHKLGDNLTYFRSRLAQ